MTRTVKGYNLQPFLNDFLSPKTVLSCYTNSLTSTTCSIIYFLMEQYIPSQEYLLKIFSYFTNMKDQTGHHISDEHDHYPVQLPHTTNLERPSETCNDLRPPRTTCTVKTDKGVTTNVTPGLQAFKRSCRIIQRRINKSPTKPLLTKLKGTY